MIKWIKSKLKQKRTDEMIVEINKMLVIIKQNKSHQNISMMDTMEILYTHLLMCGFKYVDISDVLYNYYSDIQSKIINSLKSTV
jgi:hypothetical protein